MNMADDVYRGACCTGCLIPFTQVHEYPAACEDCAPDQAHDPLVQPAVYPLIIDEEPTDD